MFQEAKKLSMDKPIAIKMFDSEGREVNVDSLSKALVVIDYEHSEIHSGDMFYVYINNEEDNGAAVEIAIQPPDSLKWSHPIFSYISEFEGNLQVIEGVTALAAGTNFVPLNKNRNSIKASSALACKTGKVGGMITYAGGNEIFRETFGSGNKRGATQRAEDEWILKQGVVTIFRLESSKDNSQLSLKLTWYERTNSFT